jgi:sulfate adenylyltransferase subunit 1
MATGASTADLAIILIDARYGIQTQTRRHSFIAKLLGIKHIVVAVNKMDLMDFSEDVYENIKKEYLAFAKDIQLSEDITLIPLSALNGDNVVDVSQKTPWYKGETLLHLLENIEIGSDRDLLHFRLSVQYVNRPNLDFRGYCGTISSGIIGVGDTITVLPSKKSSKVKEIVTYDGNLEYAYAQQAVTITLEDEIDISRGDIIVKSDEQPDSSDAFDVNIVWMSEEPLLKHKQYFIKRASSLVVGSVESFYYKTDVNTLEHQSANMLNLNEIGHAKLSLETPLAYDTYIKNKAMGSFIIIDRVTNNTLGAGMIVQKSQADSKTKAHEFSEFEIELNALVRKHFPHWDAKEIF